MKHCWKLGEKGNSCSETCNPERDGSVGKECLKYHNHDMDSSNIQEWMDSGGDTEDSCMKDGVSVGYESRGGSEGGVYGAYISAGNCYFTREDHFGVRTLEGFDEDCDWDDPDKAPLCKCKASSPVCSTTSTPLPVISDEILILDSLAEEVIEGTFPYNREKYITGLRDNSVYYPDVVLQQTTGQIYIPKTERISNDRATPNCVENWLLEIIDPEYPSGSYFYSPYKFIESTQRVFADENEGEWQGMLFISDTPFPNGRRSGRHADGTRPWMTELSGLSFRGPDPLWDGNDGFGHTFVPGMDATSDTWRNSHIIFPPIRKGITKYKLYRFFIGSSTATPSDYPALRLPEQRMDAEWLQSAEGKRWPDIDYDKVRAMRVNDAYGIDNEMGSRLEFNGTTNIPGTYNNMLFLTFNNRKCQKMSAMVSPRRECQKTTELRVDIPLSNPGRMDEVLTYAKFEQNIWPSKIEYYDIYFGVIDHHMVGLSAEGDGTQGDEHPIPPHITASVDVKLKNIYGMGIPIGSGTTDHFYISNKAPSSDALKYISPVAAAAQAEARAAAAANMAAPAGKAGQAAAGTAAGTAAAGTAAAGTPTSDTPGDNEEEDEGFFSFENPVFIVILIILFGLCFVSTAALATL